MKLHFDGGHKQRRLFKLTKIRIIYETGVIFFGCDNDFVVTADLIVTLKNPSDVFFAK